MPASGAPPSRPQPPETGVVRMVCPHDCADTCVLLAHVEQGRLVRVEGDPDHPVTRGFLCRKLTDAPQRVEDGDRLLYPLRRTGPKGSGAFERISWDDALAEIGERWRAIAAEDPFGILPFFGSGTEGLVHGEISGKRFFNRLGTLQPIRTICTRAGRTGYKHTMGTNVGADPTAIDHVELVVLWGVNTAVTNVHQHPYLKRAAANGARLVVVNPLAVKGAEQADLFLRPHPGTDAALALAVMNVIVEEHTFDADFVDRFTEGFDDLADRLKAYPPEVVEGITGVAAEDIRAFARLYAGHRPSFIYVGPGCQRHSNGGMTLRTIACLPGLTGALRFPGGGVYFPTSTVFPVDFHPLTGDDLRPNPAAGFNMIHLARLLEDPRSRSLHVCMGNPASVLYDQPRLRAALAREDLFTVVHEIRPTDTTRYADIVLPATTAFEQADLLFSYYQPSLLLSRPALRPRGEARSNLDTFNALARTMGFDDPCFRQDAWDVMEDVLALDHPALQGITLDGLLETGWAPVPYDDGRACVAKGRFPTPSGRVEFRSASMAAQGLDPLPHYRPPHESPEATPDLAARCPLRFITPSGQATHNASYGDKPGWTAAEAEPRLHIHPDDAAPRGIEDGAMVRVHNDRGDCLLRAAVSDFARPGTVASTGQWWDRMYAGGRNPNHTTPDTPADMGGGSSFNSNLVQVEPAD